MITYLSGRITDKTDKFVTIETNNIGYRVFCGEKTLGELKNEEEVRIYVHMYVREDEISLYGFLNKEELEFFELLIGISGIGPKGALAVLSIATLEELQEAIITENEAILTKVSGIGKRVAQKIILELKPKMEKVSLQLRPQVTDDIDALDALVGMGYGMRDAREALRQVTPKIKGVEERVREALKILGK